MGAVELAVEALTKTYPGTRALSDVSLDLRAGEVHAIIGENGAGKTTLLMALAGVVAPDSGRILRRGQEVRFAGPRDAQQAGIGTVFQELSLVNGLTVAENVFVNRVPAGPLGWIDRRRLSERTAGLLRLLGSELRADEPVARLTTGARQVVEIAKALSLDAHVLLMDEPTSALSMVETKTLIGVIDRLKQQGMAIVFVSHRLAEVFEIADRITIMRDGRLVASRASSSIKPDEAVRLMVGRAISSLYPERALQVGSARLQVNGLRAGTIGPVDLTVHAGEIVALAGLKGAGRSHLARAIFGAGPREGGQVRIDGRTLPPGDPVAAVRRGVAFVPSERKEEGLFMRMTLAENLVSAALHRISRWGLLRPAASRRLARTLIRDFGIRAANSRQPVVRLSGGNQQKAVLAKWLAAAPRVLIVDEPTQGIDVGAKAELHGVLRKLARNGVAVLMVSSDLPEVLGMADRIAVMSSGRIRGMLPGRDASEEQVMAYAAGEGA
jgi:rhamnose transport system ATP-binding protein